jgi:hypothetical protein
MTDRYEEWRNFYAEKVRSWMSLEELRAECGKLQTVDNPSPELLLIHAMHALEEREQRHEALLRLALEALEFFRDTAICEADTAVATEAIAALRDNQD